MKVPTVQFGIILLQVKRGVKLQNKLNYYIRTKVPKEKGNGNDVKIDKIYKNVQQ